MTKFIKAEELRAILASVPDNQPVFIPDEIGDARTIRSYSLLRFDDGSVQVTFYTDEHCGLDV